ncbi:MAG TPA: HNH endonuclease [Advenella sp.]|nr:HNH endonuclease [Advenella sp.]
MKYLEDRTIPEPNSGCYLWIGPYQSKGYGAAYIGGKFYFAHRLAWQVENGAIPKGVHCLHRCDNPACVRPEHLFLGSHSDNMADKTKKGRAAHKINADEANAILHDSREHEEIARSYGISRTTVSQIKNGRTWSFFNKGGSFGNCRIKGSKSKLAKLSEEDIPAIRSDHRSSRSIAKDYGVSKTTILAIKNRTQWAHVS